MVTENLALRQLDDLIEKARVLSDRSKLVLTGELQKLRNEVRYCFAGLGELAQDALQDVSSMMFHTPNMGDLDKAQEGKLYDDLGRLTKRLEEIRRRIEVGQSIRSVRPPGEPPVTPWQSETSRGVPSHPSRDWPIRRFPTPQDATWQEVGIRFTSEERIEVCVRDQRETRNYAEMGFEDRRKQTPDSAWHFLRKLAEQDGAITQSSRG